MKLFGSLRELVSAVFRKNNQEITLRPSQSTTYTAARDFQLPPGDSDQVLTSASSSQTLTGKTIDGDDNTVQDLALTSLKTNLTDASKFIVRDASGIPVSNTKAVPSGDVIGTTDSQVLTNKTIDADLNTLSNIEDADIKSGAAINATKLGTGVVDNTEFNRLNTVGTNAAGEIVSTDGTQTLSNKTLTNPTINAATLSGTFAGNHTISGIATFSSVPLLPNDTVETADIQNDAVTDAKLRNSTATSVIGRSAGTSGDPADIAAGSDGHVLQRSSGSLSFTQLSDAHIASGANINASKLGTGVVDNTEFNLLNTAGTNGAGELVKTDSTQTLSGKTITTALLTANPEVRSGTTLKFNNGTNTGYTALKGPAGGTTQEFTLPTTDGSAGHILQTDGGGNLSFVSASGAADTTALGVISVASDGTIVLRAGSYHLGDGRELYTASNITFDLDSKVSASGTTGYYGYIDRNLLGASSVIAGRTVVSITSAEFVVSSTTPENQDLTRYAPIFQVRYATSAWNTSDYANYAVRGVNYSGTRYTLVDNKSIGVVGNSNNGYGILVAGDFPGAASLTSFYNLDTDDGATINDDSANARNLTKNGSAVFTGIGILGKENVAAFDGVDDYYSSSNAFFNFGDTDFSIGCWFYSNSYSSLVDYTIIGKSSGADGYYIRITNGNSINVQIAGGSAIESNIMDITGWHHVALTYVASTNVSILYIDGQIVGTSTGATANTSSATNFQIGRRASTSHFRGFIQDAFATSQTLTSANVLALYEKRFNGPQIAAGHTLSSTSFPVTSLTNRISYWNLSTNSNDGSSNAKNLTNNGTIPFTGLGLDGTANAAIFNGTTQYFRSTDSLFNPGNNTSYAMGGWFAADNWNNSGKLMTNWSTASDRGYIMSVEAGPHIFISGTNTASGSDQYQLSTPVSFTGGSWHHLVYYYDFYAQSLNLYIDGVRAGYITMTNQRALTSSQFTIGAFQTSATGFLKGRARDCFFIRDVQLTDRDIRMLYSYKHTLPTNVQSIDINNRNWNTVIRDENSRYPLRLSENDWIVNQTNTELFTDIGSSPNGELIHIKMTEV